MWREATDLEQRRRLLRALRLLLTTSKRRALRHWADLASIWRRELGVQWRYRQLCLAEGYGTWRVWWEAIAHTGEAAALAHDQWRRRKLLLADGFMTWRLWHARAAGTHTSEGACEIESEITAHAQARAAVAHATKTLSLATYPNGRLAPEAALFTDTPHYAHHGACLGARPLWSTAVVGVAGGSAPLWAMGGSAPLRAALRHEALRRALDAWTDQFMRRSARRRAHEYAQLFFHNSLLSRVLVAWATFVFHNSLLSRVLLSRVLLSRVLVAWAAFVQRRRGASQTSPEAAAEEAAAQPGVVVGAAEEAAAQPGECMGESSTIHLVPASEKALYERRVSQMEGELRAAASSVLLVGARKLSLGQPQSPTSPCTALESHTSSLSLQPDLQPTLQPALQPARQPPTIPVPPAGAALSWAAPVVRAPPIAPPLSTTAPPAGATLSWAPPAVALSQQRGGRSNQLTSQLTNQSDSPMTNQLTSPLTNQLTSPLTNQLTNHQGFEGMSSRPKMDPSTYGRSPRSGLAALIAAGAAAGAAAQAHAQSPARSPGATPISSISSISATSATSVSTQQLHAVLMRSRHQLLRRM